MFRHDNVSVKNKEVLVADVVECLHEEVSALRCSEQRHSPITATRDEVKIALTITTLEPRAHDGRLCRKKLVSSSDLLGRSAEGADRGMM